jgi:hypothetical protein
LVVQIVEAIAVLVPDLRALVLFVPAFFSLYCVALMLGLFGSRNMHSAFLISLALGYVLSVALNISRSLVWPLRCGIARLLSRTGYTGRNALPKDPTGPVARFRLLQKKRRVDRHRKKALLVRYDFEQRAQEVIGALSQVQPELPESYSQLPRHWMLEYEDYNQKTVRCWLRMYPRGRCVVAIATDLTYRLHSGSSITNTIETVAAEICRQFQISPWDLVLIEHYDLRGEENAIGLRHPERFDLVELQWDRRSGEVCDPQWKRLSLEEVERVTGCFQLRDWCTETIRCD